MCVAKELASLEKKKRKKAGVFDAESYHQLRQKKFCVGPPGVKGG